MMCFCYNLSVMINLKTFIILIHIFKNILVLRDRTFIYNNFENIINITITENLLY